MLFEKLLYFCVAFWLSNLSFLLRSVRCWGTKETFSAINLFRSTMTRQYSHHMKRQGILAWEQVFRGKGCQVCTAIWNKGQYVTCYALKYPFRKLPFCMRNLDTDNGFEFVKPHVLSFFLIVAVSLRQPQQLPGDVKEWWRCPLWRHQMYPTGVAWHREGASRVQDRGQNGEGDENVCSSVSYWGWKINTNIIRSKMKWFRWLKPCKTLATRGVVC